MREYDDNIRLYTPTLQRIITLVAVIIAVPVVLWTITAFVRAYVAPPQIPSFRPIAASQGPQPTQVPVQVAASTGDEATATEARGPLLDIRKPPGSDTSQAAPRISGLNTPAPPPAPPPSVAPVSAPAMSASPVSAGVPPPPFAATRSLPATTAAPPNIAVANVAPTPAWPNPAISPPANSNANTAPADTVASQEEQPAANDDSADLPPGVPLTGQIPLPRHRPAMAGLTNVALAGGPAPGMPMPATVPLPRARPASAPEPAPVSETPYPAYEPSQLH